MSKKLNVRTQADEIELFPYGVTLGADHQRPILILKDESCNITVPVWLSPVEAGIAITQNNGKAAASSPHALSFKVLEDLGIEPVKCVLTEVKGHHQFVEVFFKGSRKLKSLSVRADQAVSFCLHARVQFFCKKEFIESCRELELEQIGLENQLVGKPGVMKNKHPYLM